MKNCLLTFIAFAISIFSFAQTPTHGPKIIFENAVHDFGFIHKTDDAVCDFVFKNVGDEPLTLLKVRPSCGCVTVDYEETPVQPGEKGRIIAKYNNNSIGGFAKTITVISNAVDNQVMTLKVKGTVLKDNLYRKNGKWGMETENGIRIPYIYDSLKNEGGKYLLAKKDGKWGIIDTNNNVVMPFKYDGVRLDKKEYYVVEKSGKCGIVDVYGNVIIPLNYSDVRFVSGDIFKAKKDNKWCAVRKGGEVLSGFSADEVYYYPDISKKVYAIKTDSIIYVNKIDGGCVIGTALEKRNVGLFGISGAYYLIEKMHEEGIDSIECSAVDEEFLKKHSYKINND